MNISNFAIYTPLGLQIMPAVFGEISVVLCLEKFQLQPSQTTRKFVQYDFHELYRV